MNINESPLKALMETAVLNDETKTVISEAFETAVKAKEAALQEAYDVKLVEAKAELKEAYMSTVQEAIAEEMEVIAEEIKHARTLEVQYADKLETFKEDYQKTLSESIDATVAEVVAEELTDLKEDIELAKKHEFVMRMFEQYREVYEKLFGSSATSIYEELNESRKELNELKREKKMAELLEGLTEKKASIARTILENVSLDKLESRFDAIRPVLLEEKDEDEGEDDKKDEGEDEGDEDKKAVKEGKGKKKVSESVSGSLVLESTGDTKNDDAIIAALEKSLRFARK